MWKSEPFPNTILSLVTPLLSPRIKFFSFILTLPVNVVTPVKRETPSTVNDVFADPAFILTPPWKDDNPTKVDIPLL